MNIIVGTAGHIDHGKTALVRALTGVETDRLPEEKRRGITIDLGFAELDLGDTRIGFVDVPGHERFVKNMLAGAHGIDAVLLVIAADSGVMPQTREHFDICRLLGVRVGCVVITKIDLVDEELLALVKAEVEELIADSFLENSPIVTVSARTNVGIDELKNTLIELARGVPVRGDETIARLPVDRAFSVRGFGVVVTGTLVAGAMTEAAEVELLPARLSCRVRGIQVHNQSVKRATAGERTAINLGGVDTANIERGMILAPAGRLRATQSFDAQIEMLESSPRPLRSRSRVRVHLGAAEVLARIVVLEDAGEIKAGESGFVQLRLERAVTCVLGERFILRSYSPSHTIAGGQVLDAFAVRHRRREREQVRLRLRQIKTSAKPVQLALMIEAAGECGLHRSDVTAATAWTDAVLNRALEAALKSEAVIDANGVLLAKANLHRFIKRTLDLLLAFHTRELLARGMQRETLREQLFAHAAPEIFRFALTEAEQAGKIVIERETVRLASHTLDLSTDDAGVQTCLEEIYSRARFEVPTIDEAIEQALAKLDASAAKREHTRKLLRMLIDKQVLVRVTDTLLFHTHAINELKAALANFARAHEPERLIDVAAFKDLAAVSRKYAIPLLEFFDRERVTARQGDKRRIM